MVGVADVGAVDPEALDAVIVDAVIVSSGVRGVAYDLAAVDAKIRFDGLVDVDRPGRRSRRRFLYIEVEGVSRDVKDLVDAVVSKLVSPADKHPGVIGISVRGLGRRCGAVCAGDGDDLRGNRRRILDDRRIEASLRSE